MDMRNARALIPPRRAGWLLAQQGAGWGLPISRRRKSSPSPHPAPGFARKPPIPDGEGLSLRRIVRALARDGHVVDVALAQARPGDPHELRLVMELGNRLRPDVTHRGAQPAR